MYIDKKKLRFTCDFAQLFNCDFPYYIINVKPWKYFFLRLNISIIIIPQSFLGPEFLVIMLPNIRYKLEFFKLFFFFHFCICQKCECDVKKIEIIWMFFDFEQMFNPPSLFSICYIKSWLSCWKRTNKFYWQKLVYIFNAKNRNRTQVSG